MWVCLAFQRSRSTLTYGTIQSACTVVTRAERSSEIKPMPPSDLIRFSLRRWLLLLLWLLNTVLTNLCVARQSRPDHAGLQIRIEPQPIRLPIVDATDNRFVRLFTSEGLSQTKADHIVQDDQGFVWFGTRYGLYRYDGYTFKVFVRDARNPNSLDGVVIKSLFKDRDGALW